MNDRSPDELTGRLAHGIEALRATQVPAGPSEELIAKTLARLGAGAGSMEVSTKEKGWWTVKKVKVTAWTAGLAAAAMVCIAWLVWGAGGKVAFADVVEQVNAAKAVDCKATVETETSADKKETMELDVLAVPPTWMIVSIEGTRMTINAEEGKALILHLKDKQASLQENKSGGLAMLDLLNAFKKLDAKEVKPVGEKVIGTVHAKGFAVKTGEMDMVIWADPETDLPISIEVDMSTGAGGPGSRHQHTTFHDFDWNAKVDSADLTLEIPKGYRDTTQTTLPADTGIQRESDLTDMLKMLAELNHGQFPDEISAKEYQRLFNAWAAERRRAETADMSDAQKMAWEEKNIAPTMQSTRQTMTAGVKFMQGFRDSEWIYAGKGLEPGEKDHPIIWYKFFADVPWEILYADGSRRESTKKPDGGVPVESNALNLPPVQTRPGTSP